MIRIHGARQNNLKNVDVELPRGRLTVVTGLSGSGKSSLAFDTLYAEGQRRYVESFSTYARQFLERMDRPDVDRIDGLLPAVALEQKNTIRSSRSTLGTLTELTEYLKVLFARLADLHCPTCGERVVPDHPSEVATALIAGSAGARAVVTFPFSAGRSEDSKLAARFLQQQGYRRVFRKGKVESLDEPDVAPLKGQEHIVVDRLVVSEAEKARLVEAIEVAYRLSDGLATIHTEAGGRWSGREVRRDRHHCGERYEAPSEGLFSFSSPQGACDACRGFGRVLDIDMDRVVPDVRRPVAWAIEPWLGEAKTAERKALREICEAIGVDTGTPVQALEPKVRSFLLDGGELAGKRWRGVRGWFKALEEKTYKMHVRIMLARYRAYIPCRVCGGSRLKPAASWYRLGDRTLPAVLAMTVEDARRWVVGLPETAYVKALAPVTTQLADRLGYLERVGLGYLTLDRQARTLSGGEIQRANLTTTLGSGLVNTLFVLDEPTVGLHAADSERLAGVLAELVARDNTVVLVEHDPDMLAVADHIVELGPGPGVHGGEVVFAGSPAAFASGLVPPGRSPTFAALDLLARPKRLARPRLSDGPALVVEGARAQNLKGVSARFPVGALTVVTGVSGSGKSTLMEEVLYRHIQRKRGVPTDPPGPCDRIDGLQHFADVVWVDQSPPQASSRAIPVTYVGAWDYFRGLFSRAPLAKARGYSPTTFSFNTGEGRCPACEGSGAETVEMQFLADVRLTCEVCQGKRFKPEVLDVEVKLGGRELSVSDVLALTVDEALELLMAKRVASDNRASPSLLARLRGLQAVGLGYLGLGQSLATLSGGEAQRLKIAEHLVDRRAATLFLLDEPTTGLHLQDVARLVEVLRTLVEGGHTVVCIEHHLDVIAAADHVIDLGPGGGAAGGSVLFAGAPADLVKQDTATGRHLARWVAGTRPLARAKVADARPSVADRERDARIIVEGARTHNLKHVDVHLPRGGRTVVSGVSGSGKSTLVFDIIFAEGQRRFLDCLSAYARQFIEQLGRPDADRIEGIPPTVAIEQRTTRGGSRSNVANVTEIEPFLRILWARLGVIRGGGVAGGLTLESLHALLLRQHGKTAVHVCAPIVQQRQGLHLDVLRIAKARGVEVVVDGEVKQPDDVGRLRKKQAHDIDFVIARVAPKAKEFRAALEEAARIGKSQLKVIVPGQAPRLFQIAGLGLDGEVAQNDQGFDPRYFSARHKLGACEVCSGYGVDGDGQRCASCDGTRLGPIGRSVELGGLTFPEVLRYSAPALERFLREIPFDKRGAAIAAGPLKAIGERVQFLEEVGLGYLGLDRAIRSLSGGEAQRIRLAAQLGAHLSGVLYVLDEPTIGLHPTDTERLLATLDQLERRGNGILMVEHDEMTLRTADVLVDIGPGAGVEGGEILAAGPVEVALASPRSITGQCLAHPRPKARPAPRPLDGVDWMALSGIVHNSLAGVDVRLPRGRLSLVTGVSGSGKSSLVEALTYAIAPETVDGGSWFAGDVAHITGADGLTTLVEIDDQPIGKNPRSTPATYVGVWDDIRNLFAVHPESKVRGYSKSRFSFNVAGGRCEACEGAGLVTLEMSFLPEAYVSCTVCNGTRYNPQTLQVHWEGHSIHDVLQMPVRDALAVFERVPRVAEKLKLLDDVGLGYLTLGQPSPTLSGGEAQRIKLVTHLVGRGQPKTVLVLDEPSIGLHMADIPKLFEVLHRLVDRGATVIVVEHNPDLMREADWIIDMGPGPGEAGGKVVYQGPFEGLLAVRESKTGQYLARTMGAPEPPPKKARRAPARVKATPKGAKRGAGSPVAT
ncbi:MAG: excinuclease ABC subunit UvrA [Deltaproteobacteria bacterium]|nr:excinuclease ABC subunit UvrA [Deltaproteobacteria bacterium]